MASRKPRRRKGTEAQWKGVAVNTGSGPKIGALSEYRARVRSLTFNPQVQEYLDRRFPGVQRTSPERQACIDQYNATIREQPKQDCIVLHHTGRVRVTLWYVPKWRFCYFVEEDFRINTIRRSIEYPSRDRAFTVFNQYKSGNGRGILWTNSPVASSLEYGEAR
jgi:hypothetical protein